MRIQQNKELNDKEHSEFKEGILDLQNEIDIPIKIIPLETTYLSINGTFNDDRITGCYYTDKVLCKPGYIYKYKGYGKYSAASVLEYNKDGDLISYKQYEATKAAIEYTVPENIYCVVFASLSSELQVEKIYPIGTIITNMNKLSDQIDTIKNNSAALTEYNKAVIYKSSLNKIKLDTSDNNIIVHFNENTPVLSDIGFSVDIGSYSILKDKDIYITSDGLAEFASYSFNISNDSKIWGTNGNIRKIIFAGCKLFEKNIMLYEVTTAIEAAKSAGMEILDTTRISIMMYGTAKHDKAYDAVFTVITKNKNIVLPTNTIDYVNSAKYADTAGNIGITPLELTIANQNNGQYICNNGSVDIIFKAGLTIKTDSGFSVYLGLVKELKDKNIYFRYSDNKYIFKNIAINFGAAWGEQTYKDQNVSLSDNGLYYISINAAIKSITNGTDTSDNVKVYMMVYNESYTDTTNEISFSIDFFKLNDAAIILSKDIEKIPKIESDIKSLDNKVSIITESTDNILYGKKYVACGDSFTQGDFSGWTDENGLSGKNSPVIYDSDMGYYKTYPWWIAKRNNMTLINEALCGSIIALDKDYVTSPDTVSQGTRSPFTYQRYLRIPEDADYITIWFGINDSAHTNLGTIDDTTNETFYGAWNFVLKWLITNRPYAKIGIIITNGAAESYRKAEREVADKWGIPYLDMMGDRKIPVIFGRESSLKMCSEANTLRRNKFVVTPSNGHPNIEAHKYQSTFIENFLRSL